MTAFEPNAIVMTERGGFEHEALAAGWALNRADEHTMFGRDGYTMRAHFTPEGWMDRVELSRGEEKLSVVGEGGGPFWRAREWLRYPVLAQADPAVVKAVDQIVAMVGDTLAAAMGVHSPDTVRGQVLMYAAELEAMPDTGLIGPRGAAERLRSILSGVQR